MACRQSLRWGKGTKRLIDRAINLGYKFEIQSDTVEMIYTGKGERQQSGGICRNG